MSALRFWATWLGIVGFCVAVWLVVIILALSLMTATGYAATPHAGGGRVPACATVRACHRAIAWQAKDRAHLRHQLATKWTRDTRYGIRLAHATLGTSASDMLTIARCESGVGQQKYAESGTGASGPFQFLPSTWRRTPFAGFDIFDPVANSLAAAWLHAKDGSWREWSCSSITGVR